ncbi:hypothetical protein P9112_009913 [Eukaryota sp. TZLM1-RC]
MQILLLFYSRSQGRILNHKGDLSVVLCTWSLYNIILLKCREVFAQGYDHHDIQFNFMNFYIRKAKSILIAKAQAESVGISESNSSFETMGYLVIDSRFEFPIGFKRAFREKHLYISGPSSIEKTTVVRLLQKAGLKVYMAPEAGKFEDFCNFKYDVCVADEPTRIGTTGIVHWLAWLDGGTINVNARYYNVQKMQNLPTIFLSNLTIQEIVLDTVDQDQKFAFESRFAL